MPTACLPTPRIWSVSTVARRDTRNPIACGAIKADLEKAKVEGRPAVPPRPVHAVAYEDGHPSSSSIGDEARSSGGTPRISVINNAPSEVAYVWVLSAASMRTKHYPKGIMLDSGAAVSVCPSDYFPECGIRSGRHIELLAADGSPVEHYGSREVIYKLGEEVTWTSRQTSDTEAW